MLYGFLSRLFSSTDDEDSFDPVLGGADEVMNAILEHTDEQERYTVWLAEPELVDRGGQYTTDYMVRISTETAPGEPEPPNIEYELPEGDVNEDSRLFELLDVFDLDTVSEIDQLADETVAATFEDGVLTLRFDLLDEE